MRKLAPVFLISVFALAAADGYAMGDRNKSKTNKDANTTSTPATASPQNPAADNVPKSTTSAPTRADSATVAANDSTRNPNAATPATPSSKANPARQGPNCVNGKDTRTGLECQSLGGDGSSGASSSGSGASGSSSSSSGSGSSSGSSK